MSKRIGLVVQNAFAEYLPKACGWRFLRGERCGDLATVRTAGGLHLCADHLTDWARGVYRPSWVVLATGEMLGGITHGQRVL